MDHPSGLPLFPADHISLEKSGLALKTTISAQSDTSTAPSPSEHVVGMEVVRRVFSATRTSVVPSISAVLPAPTDSAPAGLDGHGDELMEETVTDAEQPAASTSSNALMNPAISAEGVAAPSSLNVSEAAMAGVIGQQEHLRRDRSDADAVYRPIETPKALASDVKAIERKYAASRDWAFIAPRMEQILMQKIMASLSGKRQ